MTAPRRFVILCAALLLLAVQVAVLHHFGQPWIAASGVRDFLFEPCSDEELSARLRRVVSPLEARGRPANQGFH